MISEKKEQQMVKVLISQPAPKFGERTPYSELETKYNAAITYRKLIKSESVSTKEYCASKIEISDFTGIIITSRHVADFLFHIIEQLRLELADGTKFLCTSEAIALYMQKFMRFRKRKILFPDLITNDEFVKLLFKHKTEKFLFPTAVGSAPDLLRCIDQDKIDITCVDIYRTIPDDVKDVNINDFQMIVLFSPIGVSSIQRNFPNFKQENRVIATFGNSTVEAVKNGGFRPDIVVPTPTYPSMAAALKAFFESKK
jgi:uroporphyrinogen-III synthase